MQQNILCQNLEQREEPVLASILLFQTAGGNSCPRLLTRFQHKHRYAGANLLFPNPQSLCQRCHDAQPTRISILSTTTTSNLLPRTKLFWFSERRLLSACVPHMRLKEAEQEDHAVGDFCEGTKFRDAWNTWQVEKCQSILYRDKQQSGDCAKPSPASSHPEPEREK
jgi:hypothetical protein